MLATSCASPSGSLTHSLYGGYDARKFSAGEVSVYPRGGRIGYGVGSNTSPYSGFVEGGYVKAQTVDFDILSVAAGGRVAAFRRSRLEFGGLGFLQFQGARLDEYKNGNSLLGIGLGGYAEVRIVPRVSLVLTVSAHAFGDVTPPTTCNDGSTSQSTGSGTCSSHDGIAFSNDILGNGTAVDALIGVSIGFGQRPAHRPNTSLPPSPESASTGGNDSNVSKLVVVVDSTLERVECNAILEESELFVRVVNKSDDPVIVYWSESTVEIDGGLVGQPGAMDASDPIPSLGELHTQISQSGRLAGYDLRLLNGRQSVKVHLTVRRIER